MPEENRPDAYAIDSLAKSGAKRLKRPDFVSVTRGPGMRSNLAVGLDTAKGLALAWDVPLLAVHHMQAHALTPRLVSALATKDDFGDATVTPAFPFLTLLVSGGHTMLLSSTSLVEHKILAETNDIALGDCLDKAARAILPLGFLEALPANTPFGCALELFAFPGGASDYEYNAPSTRS
ncbi:Mitochondrial tRNAs modification protein, partial [Elasticomyces elasticus]